MKANEIHKELAQFYGSEQFFNLSPFHFNMVVTEGVKFLADAAGAYWLLDIIATESLTPKMKRYRDFQVWKMTTDLKSKTALIIAENGNGKKIHERPITFTDFPLPEIEFFLELGSLDGVTPKRVLMLPSER